MNNFQHSQPQPLQQQQLNKNPWSNGQQNSSLVAQLESINTQQQKLREQIIQSEKNLQAQHQVWIK
jgi:hypothetical protein